MTKKHFIALADHIKESIRLGGSKYWLHGQIELLAEFCRSQNPRFDRDRWIGYIHGENGPSGGKR